MKQCKCGETIPCQVSIEGKRKNLQSRTSCLKCIPFGTSVYSKKLTSEQRLLKNADKQRRHYSRYVEKHGLGRANKIKKARKALVVEKLGGGCMECGYSRCMRNLSFHHVGKKDFPLSEHSFQFSWGKLLPEISKCVLLCHNCHGEVHDKIIDVSKSVNQTSELLKNWQPI